MLYMIIIFGRRPPDSGDRRLYSYYFSDISENKYPFFIAKCKILCYFALKQEYIIRYAR